MATETGIVLALESAVSGGSISLIRDCAEIANHIGKSVMAKAEHLLVDIDALLKSNSLVVDDITLIAASAGPGSFTGIRIGIATALGLKTGLDAAMASESALKAMASAYPGHACLTVAVPAGRDAVCVQEFDTTTGEAVEADNARTERESNVLAAVSTSQGTRWLLHADLFERASDTGNAIDFGRNIAFALGRLCDRDPRPQTPPIFISKSF